MPYNPNFTDFGIPPWMVTTPQGQPYPQNDQGQVVAPTPTQPGKPPIAPRSEMTPAPMPAQVTPETAASTVGETPNDTQNRQPGNRKSIKEYLDDIHKLQAQLRARGVPEQDLPVPTFTNVQGGPLDVEQGQLLENPQDFDAGTGGQPTSTRPVRSYMWPEYQQAGPMAPPTMGPEHVIVKGAQAAGMGMQTTGADNVIDPNYPNAQTVKMFPEIREALRRQLKREPTPQEFAAAAHRVRSSIMQQQMKEIKEIKNTFKNAGAADLWEYLQSGDVSKVVKEADKMNSPEARQKRRAAIIKEWQNIQDKASTDLKPYPDNPETGMPYQSGQEYIDQKTRQFDSLMGWVKQKTQSFQPKSPGGPTQNVTRAGATSSRAQQATQYYLSLRQQNVPDEQARAEVLKMFPEFAKGK